MASLNASSKLKKQITSAQCGNCGVVRSDLKSCSRCGLVFYCSKECQTQHWRSEFGHKANCVSPEKRSLKHYVQRCSTTVTHASNIKFIICSICLEPMNTNSAKTLPCTHKFHRNCLALMIAQGCNDTCPLCREPISDPSDIETSREYTQRHIRNFMQLRLRIQRKGTSVDGSILSWKSPEVLREMRTIKTALWIASDNGDVNASLMRGHMLQMGEGMKLNPEDANLVFAKLATLGNAKAQNYLGVSKSNGYGCNIDLAMALSLFEDSAAQGFAMGQCNLAVMLMKHPYLDIPKAIFQLQKAVDQGLDMAQYHLGKIYARGFGVSKDIPLALALLTKAVDQGVAAASTTLGVIYGSGDGVPCNLPAAMQYYRKAMHGNDPMGQFNVLSMLADGYPTEPGEDVLAMLRTNVHNHGEKHCGAYFLLGRHLLNLAETNAVRPSEAIFWLTKAADRDHTGSLLLLAEAYLIGRVDLPIDLCEAFRFYFRGAELGCAHAQGNVAMMYSRGLGVQQSNTLAFKYNSLSASQDHAQSTFFLAMMYFHGHGVPQDKNEAVRLLLIASKLGYSSAEHMLAESGKLM